MPLRKSSLPSFAGVAVVTLVSLCAFVGLSGACSAPEGDPTLGLRDSFPAQANAMLDKEVFVPTAFGFALASPAHGTSGALDVSLPLRGEEPFIFRGPGGFEAQVIAEGMGGEGALQSGALTYRRAGGTSFWTVAAGGLEEWLLLDAGVARAGHVVASYQVLGATLRESETGISLVDDEGVSRIFVSAPEAFALGGRPVDATLGIAGDRLELSVDADGEVVLVDPLWTATGPMTTGRNFFAQISLGNGKGLVAAGQVPGSQTALAELYDPATNLWTSAGSISAAREWVAGAWIPSVSKALVVGGQNSSVSFKNADLYDQATNTWSAGAPMGTARNTPTLTLLATGKVLAAGGGAASAEVYDPVANSWAATGAMIGTRVWHSATLLASGKVLVSGGLNGNGLATGETYDPATNTWTATGNMTSARLWFTLSTLSTGKAIAVGGAASFGGASLTSTDLYDPATNTWSAGAAMVSGRQQHTATVLGTGKVLVAGGNGTAATELYDPTTNTWSASATMSSIRAGAAASLLSNGKVLISSGLGGGAALKTAEVYSNANGTPCTTGTDCASGLCADSVCCNTACNAGACDACSVAAGAPSDGTCALLTGTTCNDANACTQTDTCQNGVCTGANPVVCTPLDQCHVAGTCNTGTGVCTNPNKANNSACNDANACTQTDTCQNGACVGANPVVCSPLDQCHVAGTCNTSTGLCSNPNQMDGTLCNDANACTQSDTCQAGACTGANPVVCSALDQCHSVGTCNTATGVCSNPNKPNNTACNDGDACTQVDTCQAGACQGASPVVCTPSDQCHDAGTCDSVTGTCSNPASADGTSCNDGDGCTQTDTCQAGACMGANPVQCAAIDQCHVAGTCDSVTGACSTPAVADGTACDDGDGCTQMDSCQAGVCVGGTQTQCPALNDCQDPGKCDPTTGQCVNPQKADGTLCDDGDGCTQKDSCAAGACVGSDPVVCSASDLCHDVGSCDPATGQCSDPPKALDCTATGPCVENGSCDLATGECAYVSKLDGQPCPGGQCIAGECVPDPDSGSSSDAGSSTGSGSGSGSGSGGAGASGSAGAGANGSSGDGSGSGANGAGDQDVGLRGSGACAAAPGERPGDAAWVLVALSLGLARRRRARGAAA